MADSRLPQAQSAVPAAVHAPGAQQAVPVRAHLRFDGVYLLTSGPEGPTAVPGLHLALEDGGVTLAKGDGSPVWTAGWDQVAEVATPERSTLPDGTSGVVLVVTTRQDRSHRFVVPAGQPAALEAALGSLARSHGVAPPPPEPTRPVALVVGVIAVVAVVVAVLLLAAGHVIHL